MDGLPTKKRAISACFNALELGVLLLMIASCARITTPIAFTINSLLVSDSVVASRVDAVPDHRDHVLPPNSICHLAGPVVLEATRWEVYIGFRPSAGLWYIAHSPYQPGEGGDAVQNGFVCHLPAEFKKSGLHVHFSGRYYHAGQYITRENAGETVLYLDLTAIQAG